MERPRKGLSGWVNAQESDRSIGSIQRTGAAAKESGGVSAVEAAKWRSGAGQIRKLREEELEVGGGELGYQNGMGMLYIW